MASSRSRCSHLAVQIFDRTGQKFTLDFSVQIFVRLAWFRVNGTSKRANFDRSKIRPVLCERGVAYDDKIVEEFMKYVWPINYQSHQLKQSTLCNHPLVLAFADHVRAYIDTFNAIAVPFLKNPLHQPLICSPLHTVPKRGSPKRRVVMDLMYSPSFSVNSGIPSSTYLDSPFKLCVHWIDRLRELISSKGRDCYVFKKDLQHAYRQFPIDPKGYLYWVLLLTINCILTLDAHLAKEA